jgi:hypothetical protein
VEDPITEETKHHSIEKGDTTQISVNTTSEPTGNATLEKSTHGSFENSPEHPESVEKEKLLPEVNPTQSDCIISV